MNQTVWIDGRLADAASAGPSIASISLHLGMGVFEGIMAYDLGGRYNVHLGEQHIARMQRNAAEMGIPLSVTTAELLTGIDELLATCGPGDRYIRPIAFKREPGIMFAELDEIPTSVAILALPTTRSLGKPISCRLSSYRRINGDAIPIRWKSCGSYVNSTLAQREASDTGFGTGVMLDGQGFITETSTSNMFFMRHERLVTPAITPEVFPGLTRALVIELANKQGIEVEERRIHPSELAQFEGAMLTGTLSELRPISHIDSAEYNTESLPCYKAVLSEFADYVDSAAGSWIK